MTMPDVARPRLVGTLATVRPGRSEEVEALRAILAEPSVAHWWGALEPSAEVATKLLGDADTVLLVIEVDGAVAGGIEYHEENEPMYRHAGIDIYLSDRHQGRGVGTEAVGMLARFLIEGRGQRGRDPLLREGRVSAGRGHAPVRVRARRDLPRRPADGPAPRGPAGGPVPDSRRLNAAQPWPRARESRLSNCHPGGAMLGGLELGVQRLSVGPLADCQKVLHVTRYRAGSRGADKTALPVVDD